MQKASHIFQFGLKSLKFTSSYKYLGLVFIENARLSESARRVCGSELNKMKPCPHHGISTFPIDAYVVLRIPLKVLPFSIEA